MGYLDMGADENYGGVYCSIPVTNVGAGLDSTIQVQVAEEFQVRKLVVGANRADFAITQMKIGTVDQDVGQGGRIPAGIFTPDNTVALRGSVVEPGPGLTLRVLNTSAGALDFDGAFFGPAAQPA